MKKQKTTPSYADLAERERMKDIMALRPDKKAQAALRKEMEAYPARKIETHSGALRSPLGDIKP